MFLRIVALAAVMVSLPLVASAQESRDDLPSLSYVLDRYYDNLGGLGAIGQLQSLRLEGSLELESGTLQVHILKKVPSYSRTTFQRGQVRSIQGYNGEVAWQVPMGGDPSKPVAMSPAMARSYIRSAPLANPLITYTKTGEELELVGRAGLPGNTEAYIVRVRYDDGAEADYYLDTRSFHLRRIATRQDGFEEQVIVPSDFRAVNNVLVAHRLEYYEQGQLTSTLKIREVEANLGLLLSLFSPPAPLVEPEAESASATN